MLPVVLLGGAALAALAAFLVRPTPTPPTIGLGALAMAHDLGTARGIMGEDF